MLEKPFTKNGSRAIVIAFTSFCYQTFADDFHGGPARLLWATSATFSLCLCTLLEDLHMSKEWVIALAHCEAKTNTFGLGNLS